ncbi:MAG: YecA family protein [Gammaproteobacteria bacterium]|nr:YecA family protein [Gammaproteobacteria bacterium]
MQTTADFTNVQADRLALFLADPQRPEGTMSYFELAGFLFAIASSPEIVPSPDWVSLIFDDQDPNYESLDQTNEILGAFVAFYNSIHQQVVEECPTLPANCELRSPAIENLVNDAPLGQWAKGFSIGHDYLENIWDEYAPDEIDEEFGSILLALSFFSNRELAQAYIEEAEVEGVTLEQMAAEILDILPDAMKNYALLGQAIHQAILEQASEPTTGKQ